MDEGVYGGTAYVINLENRGEVMDFNPDFDLPSDVRDLADETVQGIIDGSITIPMGD
jgi:hypothetical protein